VRNFIILIKKRKSVIGSIKVCNLEGNKWFEKELCKWI